MPEQIVFFQDYLLDVSPSEKRSLLEEARTDIQDRFQDATTAQDSVYERLSRPAYRGLLTEFRRAFGSGAHSALSAFVAAGPQSLPVRALSGGSRETIAVLHERQDEFQSPLASWALSRENWFLVNTDLPSLDLEARLSPSVPCLVFENCELEYAGPTPSLASIEHVDEILQTTGIDQLWARGNFGQHSSIIILDTGVDQSVSAHPDVQTDALDGMSTIDTDGHGTAVAELVRALCPSANIVSVRIMDSSRAEAMNLVAGLCRLLGRTGVVINLSLGISPRSIRRLGRNVARLPESLTSLVSGHAGFGNLAVSAAGNEAAPQLAWPAATSTALAVGSHDASLRRSTFSNYSDTANNYVLAPGGEVTTATGVVRGFGRYGRGLAQDVYATSFSTAIASSLAGLLLTYDWFRAMQVASRVSLFRHSCRRNSENFPLLNVADVGAIWPI